MAILSSKFPYLSVTKRQEPGEEARDILKALLDPRLLAKRLDGPRNCSETSRQSSKFSSSPDIAHGAAVPTRYLPSKPSLTKGAGPNSSLSSEINHQ